MPLMLKLKHHERQNMSVRTTVTLDDDVIERVKLQSKSRGVSFRDALNYLLRAALVAQEHPPQKRTLKIEPIPMGLRPGLSYDDIESLLEYSEGPAHR